MIAAIIQAGQVLINSLVGEFRVFDARGKIEIKTGIDARDKIDITPAPDDCAERASASMADADSSNRGLE